MFASEEQPEPRVRARDSFSKRRRRRRRTRTALEHRGDRLGRVLVEARDRTLERATELALAHRVLGRRLGGRVDFRRDLPRAALHRAYLVRGDRVKPRQNRPPTPELARARKNAEERSLRRVL